ncbi:MAG: response regulator [Chloroflexi bacterium]|nr:response regulator [Chloroflexota bacterium]
MSHKPRKILLIEDNTGDVRLIREMLAEMPDASWELESVGQLSTGLECVAKQQPDIILLDLGLPDSQGLETLDKICSKTTTVPIVVLTGLDDEAIASEAVHKGAQDYLLKDDINVRLLRRVMRYAIERKRMEVEKGKIEQKAQLASRLASIGELASGVAHEINNPLTGVIGYAQLLLAREDIPEDIRHDIEIINEGAQRVAGIVKKLLAFARQTRPEQRYVNINELIRNSLDLQAYALAANNIKVSLQLAGDLPMTIADPGQLQQVFLNLIMNAQSAMQSARDSGKLLIKTGHADNVIRISFKDNGPGIPKKNLERVFDPFFTTREVGQGTGLGLSACYGIITEHKGKIWAESEPGKGANLIIELPVIAYSRHRRSGGVKK